MCENWALDRLLPMNDATGASCILVRGATPYKMTADRVMKTKRKPEDDKVTSIISANRLLTIW